MKRKLSCLFLIFSLLLASMPIDVFATPSTIEITQSGVEYSLNLSETTAKVIGVDESTLPTDLTIPSVVSYNTTPYNVTTINSYAFQYCTKLTSVTIPTTVTDIGTAAFSGCTNLKTITVAEGNTNYKTNSEKTMLLTIDGKTLINYAMGATATEPIFPAGVETIADEAFERAYNLISVTIPSSVTSIGTSAFKDLELTSIDLSGCTNLTSLPYGLFYYCKKLTTVKLPSSVTNIDDSVFYGCSRLKSLIIPHLVTSVGSGICTECKSLETIFYPATFTDVSSWNIRSEANKLTYTVDTTQDVEGKTKVTITSSTNTAPATIPCNALGKDYIISIDSSLSSKLTLNHVYNPTGKCNCGNDCSHSWQDPTCTEPKTCSVCGKTDSSYPASGHNIDETSKVCSKCGYISLTATDIGETGYAVTPIDLDETEEVETKWKATTEDGVTFYESQNSYLPKNDTYYEGSDLKEEYRSCTMEIKLNVPANTHLEYEWKQSSENNYDKLHCYLNDVEVDTLKNQEVWTQAYINLPEGENTIKFVYKKDDSEDSRDDKGYLKNLVVKQGHLEFYPTSDFLLLLNSSDNTATILASNSSTVTGEYELPSSINCYDTDYDITGLSNYAVAGCSGLTKLTIPKTITSIADGAIIGCMNLKKIEVNEQNEYYTTENDGLFLMPKDKTTILAVATKSLPKDLVLPEGLLSIGNEAFALNMVVRTVTLPSSIKEIGEGAFRGSVLSKINLENATNLTSLGARAFKGCELLTEICIPASVTEIKAGTFRDCNALSKVTFAEGSQLTTIRYCAFKNCRALPSIEIPATVKAIKQGAFDNCSGLANVTFAEDAQLELIGIAAFEDCDALRNIEIPATVKAIKKGAFDGCEGLCSVTFAKDSQLELIGKSAFEDCDALSSINIPKSVKIIKAHAFEDCESLRSVTFEEGSQLETICYKAFDNCTSLPSITIPASVTEIKENAFSYCKVLKTVTFDSASKLTMIGLRAFRGCISLTSAMLPKSVTEIKTGAFRGCTNMETFVIPHEITVLSNNVLKDCDNLETLFLTKDVDISSADASSSVSKIYYEIDGDVDDSGKQPVKIVELDLADSETLTELACSSMGSSYIVNSIDSSITGLTIEHKSWTPATCESPTTCFCGKTEGGALGHDWLNATYTDPKTCSRCGKTEGPPLGGDYTPTIIDDDTCTHEWADATCTTPKTCSLCGETEGEALGHNYTETIIEPTDTNLGGTLYKCSNTGCTDSYYRNYTLKTKSHPTYLPDGRTISGNVPSATTSVTKGNIKLNMIFQDPLGAVAAENDLLSLSVTEVKQGSDRWNELMAQRDDDHDIEHIHLYDINPVVNNVTQSGEFSKKVRLLYEIPEEWDRGDLQVALIAEGEDGEFDEGEEILNGKRYLVVWTDHFSPYAFIDTLSAEEKAQGQTGVTFVKTGESNVCLVTALLLSTISAGLFLEMCLRRRFKKQ